jgi:hypothetical protein
MLPSSRRCSSRLDRGKRRICGRRSSISCGGRRRFWRIGWHWRHWRWIWSGRGGGGSALVGDFAFLQASDQRPVSPEIAALVQNEGHSGAPHIPAPIPEISTSLAMLIGMAVIVVARLRRRGRGLQPIEHILRQRDEMAALPVWTSFSLAALGQRRLDRGEGFGGN